MSAEEAAERVLAHAAPGTLLGLLFDYDGTLAEIAPRPEDARLQEPVRRALIALAAHRDVRVAIVTGRSRDGLLAVSGPLPGLALATNGGFVLTDAAGEWIHPEAAKAAPLLREAAERLSRIVAAHPGTQLEDKGFSLSVHFRRAPEAEGVLRNAVQEEVSRAPGALRVLDGKAVFELQPAIPWDKGRALDALCDRWGLAEHAAFFGDDVIDEPALTAMRARGGLAVRVGADVRESAAEVQLPSVAELQRLVSLVGARLP